MKKLSLHRRLFALIAFGLFTQGAHLVKISWPAAVNWDAFAANEPKLLIWNGEDYQNMVPLLYLRAFEGNSSSLRTTGSRHPAVYCGRHSFGLCLPQWIFAVCCVTHLTYIYLICGKIEIHKLWFVIDELTAS